MATICEPGSTMHSICFLLSTNAMIERIAFESRATVNSAGCSPVTNGDFIERWKISSASFGWITGTMVLYAGSLPLSFEGFGGVAKFRTFGGEGGAGNAAGIVGGGAVLVEVLEGAATPFDVPEPEASALLVTTGIVGFFRCRISKLPPISPHLEPSCLHVFHPATLKSAYRRRKGGREARTGTGDDGAVMFEWWWWGGRAGERGGEGNGDRSAQSTFNNGFEPM
ncbi:predicted protein [Postia placenta Mad-698-R]|nr:predicted protein [Postia placenta Mad-698-R]